jgi:hypothetical protein
MRLLRMSLVIAALTMCMCTPDLKRAESADGKQVNQYVNGPMGRYSSLFEGVYYAGTDNAFDYVAIKHRSSSVKMFKLQRGNLDVKEQMKVNGDEKKWVDITGMFGRPQ